MSKPLVSIVLPTYNRAHLLEQAIRSVLTQTYTALELIVVDDNSPDTTHEIVQRIKDTRVRYVKNDPNLKLPRALNRGFSIASGAYLTWTSDDNLMAPTAIEKMVQQLEEGGCDFVYADYWLFSEQDASGRPINPQRDHLPDKLQLDKGNHIGACFLYTRRLYETVGDYDPELFLVEDYDYFLRAARHFEFNHIDEPLYYFRRDEATLYCSRFPEVKASDVLVRLKNNVIDTGSASNLLADLLVQHPGDLKHSGLRHAIAVRERVSHRLGKHLVKRGFNLLVKRIAIDIAPLFEAYRAGESSFADVRSALLDCISSHGKLAYVGRET
ncbi:MAG: glycosyltransferase [Pseudomonadota bacterium]